MYRTYREVTRAANIPIIGMGGIQDTHDAIEFLLAGASAVAVGTALFVDPTIPARIAAGLSAYFDAHRLAGLPDLMGKLRVS